MGDKLFIACVIFFIIDLCFVGTTTVFVVKLVTKILNEKSILEEVRKLLLNYTKGNVRNFIEKGLVSICKHCGKDLSIRNPTGYCDHLYYPENCEVCKKGDNQ
jgi:hypothetical protein